MPKVVHLLPLRGCHARYRARRPGMVAGAIAADLLALPAPSLVELTWWMAAHLDLQPTQPTQEPGQKLTGILAQLWPSLREAQEKSAILFW